MNAILESGFSPPPRILRRPAGRGGTGLARRTIRLRIALGERAAGWIEVEVDAGLRPRIEASRREPEPLTRSGGQTRLIRPFGLVRQLVNGSGISRGAEPEARSRSDVGTRRDDRRDARGRGRRGREQRRRE